MTKAPSTPPPTPPATAAARPLAALMRERRHTPGGHAAPPFDVVVVGSGYGGSIAAFELAGTVVREPDGTERPIRLCLLERGRGFDPGDFPASLGELPRELRVGNQRTGTVTGAMGLYDLRMGPDVAALVANGLGGGSLINAGVMLEPRLEDFAGQPFAHELDDLRQAGHFARARRLLGAEVPMAAGWVPNDILRLPGRLPKTAAMERLAQQGGRRCEFPPITVSLDGAPNAAGGAMQACNHCGDCMTGCNVGAKVSLDRNLLAAAAARGCDIVTGATVTSLMRGGQGQQRHWVLRVAHTDPRLQERESDLLYLPAHRVVLAAGALGSPEILLRSRNQRPNGDALVFSPGLGAHFSCNGDNIAAAQDLHGPAVNGTADADLPPGQRGVGPTITASITLRGDAAGADRAARPFLLQEFAVPAPLKWLFEETVALGRTLADLPRPDDSEHDPSQADPLAVDPQRFAHTLLVGQIGHDDARGSLRLALPRRPADGSPPTMGTLAIDWPTARHGADLDDALRAVRRVVEGRTHGPGSATLVPNPLWRLLPEGLEHLTTTPRGPVLTVHPLGGCAMGPVVDRHGAVVDFNPPLTSSSDAWEGTLVVLDGSIVPQSLGVNPALTISALALRAMAHWQQQWFGAGEVTASQRLLSTAQPDGGHVVPPAPHPPDPAGLPPIRRTIVNLVERLSGKAYLPDIGPVALELTLQLQAMPLALLSGPQRPPLAVQPEGSHLRVYAWDVWEAQQLRQAGEGERQQHALFESGLVGQVRFLHREASGPWQRKLRGLAAWVHNRGTRDLYERWRRDGTWSLLRQLVSESGQTGSLAGHAGEVRRLDYALTLGKVRRSHPRLDLAAGQVLHGRKRLTYACAANPWKQLIRLELDDIRGPKGRAVLELEPRFLAAKDQPLLNIVHQRHQVEALAELASLGLYLTRVLLSTHLWSFRKPDARNPREPDRLPRPIDVDTLDASNALRHPQVIELAVDRWPAGSVRAGQPLTIRLTRYAQPDSPHPPLVMIHGYSVSGNTFTHPSLGATSAAAWFHRVARRDVWVLDLRTSSALDSAHLPWAMEGPALIDIPAALLQVRNLTGRRVDVLAHCIGCVMLSMAVLSDAADVARGKQWLGVDTWLSSEHLATLDAFNRRPAVKDAEHPVIRRIVLSQKGPRLRYTDANVLRGHVMGYLRRLLLPGGYSFRPPVDPPLQDQLLDRLLASLPYPDDEFRIENPWWPCARRSWTATRHRMDALYGRDFNAANMGDATLEAIDDLFGPINLDTVAQTIHFMREDAITSQNGRGDYLSPAIVRQRWGGIATLGLHGRDNGLVDRYTQTLLARLLDEESGVPFQSVVLDGMGHQDVLIGQQRTASFEAMREFLDGAGPVPKKAPDLRIEISEPWLGPRLALPPLQAQLSVVAQPRFERRSLRLVLLPLDASKPGRTLLRSAPLSRRSKEPGAGGTWLAIDVGPDLLDQAGSVGCEAWLAVMAAWPDDPPIINPLGSGTIDFKPIWDNAQTWLDETPATVIERCTLRHSDLLRTQRLSTARPVDPPASWSLAFASCQYPRGLVDRRPAGASLSALAARLDDTSLVLLLGDQIYADATAGLQDPSRRDERYDWRQQDALRLEPMREVLRRVPVLSMADDHEIVDNWDPLPEPERAASQHGTPEDGRIARRRHEQFTQRQDALRSFLHHQRVQPAGCAVPSDLDLVFSWGGHPFYLLDTRSARRRPAPGDGAHRDQLISQAQRGRFQQWLELHASRLKFVATPSLLLPRRRSVARHAAEAPSCDGWDGFPDSRNWLLSQLLDHDMGRTVFLSGDEHQSLAARVTLQRGDLQRSFWSLHSSGLYAPFPFANSTPADLSTPSVGDVDVYADGDISVTTELHAQSSADGFARLTVEPRAAGGSRLTLTLVKTDGSSAATLDLTW